MKTVSTLCATATVVGVSAAGYALGRPDPLPSDRSASKRKHSSELDQLMPSSFRPAPTALPSPLPPRTPASDYFPQPAARPSTDGRSSSQKARRTALGDTAVSRLTSNDDERVQARERMSLDIGPRLTLRSRPSWMRRFSQMSSHDTTPASSPRPQSPSLVYSTNSPSFSQSGSTVPMVGSRPAQLPPNKLVKRSSSQGFTMTPPPTTKFSSLRRPATSHQRTATLQQFSQSFDVARESTPPILEIPSRVRQPSPEPRWRQFFSVKVSGSGPLSRKRGVQSDARAMKRIVPENGCFPTLITAKSILTSSMQVDESYDPDDASIFLTSRPSSAYLDSFGLGLQSRGAMGARLPVQPPGDGAEPEELGPRRSFSFHDLLPSGPTSRKQPTSQRLSRRLSMKSARRVFSDPLAGLGIARDSSDVERPAKRRDITDPTVFQKMPNTSHPSVPRSGQLSISGDRLPSSPFTVSSSNPSQTSPSENYSPAIAQTEGFLGSLKLDKLTHSPILPQLPIRGSNYSAATSERASTLVGSESEARGVQTSEDDDAEAGSDTLYDSIRTRTTRSLSNVQGSRIDTIFDESPPARKTRGVSLREAHLSRTLTDSDLGFRENDDIIEEEESVATPVRTIRSDKADSGSPIARRIMPQSRSRSRSPLPMSLNLPSSPPEISKALSLGTLEYDDESEEEEEDGRWSAFDAGARLSARSIPDEWSVVEQVATPLSMKRSNPMLVNSSSPSTTPQALDGAISTKGSKIDLKSSLFDWSEQPAENSPGNRSPPRPRTVHGKKDTDTRGSRSVGRRAPSGLHARSQSVPVVPDLAGKRETVVTNKFGTWGVGSKGVSEDWNEDFDFGDGITILHNDREEKRIDSGVAMHIPQLIRDQQVNVMTNIGLVREFGLLVEELKALRVKALAHGLLSRPRNDLWDEIDAMIDLADQEADTPPFPRRMTDPPSSPGFGSDSLEESAEHSLVENSTTAGAEQEGGVSLVGASDNRPRRKSVLPLESDVFETPPVASSARRRRSTNKSIAVPSGRPRKDSEAMARSVIEALKKRSTAPEQLALQPVPSSKKVPFDTTTLRHIVPYVNGLTRKVREQLREAERLNPSDDSTSSERAHNSKPPQDPPLSNLFKDPLQDSPSSRKSRRNRALSKSVIPDENVQGIDDMNKSMKMMTVM